MCVCVCVCVCVDIESRSYLTPREDAFAIYTPRGLVCHIHTVSLATHIRSRCRKHAVSLAMYIRSRLAVYTFTYASPYPKRKLIRILLCIFIKRKLIRIRIRIRIQVVYCKLSDDTWTAAYDSAFQVGGVGGCVYVLFVCIHTRTHTQITCMYIMCNVLMVSIYVCMYTHTHCMY